MPPHPATAPRRVRRPSPDRLGCYLRSENRSNAEEQADAVAADLLGAGEGYAAVTGSFHG